MMIADIGFILSAIGYSVLLLLLFAVRKPGMAKYLLIVATAATALWSLSHVSLLFGPVDAARLVVADTVMQMCWLLFLLACLKDDFSSLRQVVKNPVSWGVLAIPAVALVLPQFFHVEMTWRYLSLTIISLEALLLLELIYRQADKERWAFKPLVLFLGVTNLFAFVTFANATMVEKLEFTYIEARGYIYVALLPFLVLAIRRIKHWGVNIFISRDVVLHSSLLMVAGAYLFVMAMAGYAVRYVGGEWGPTVQVVLFVLSLVLLLTLFLSNSFRIKIRVFITKHFFANQFDYRLEWLKLTESLQATEGGLSDVYHAALQGLIQAIDYKSGLLLKYKGKRLDQLASVAHDPLTPRECELLTGLTDFLSSKNWIIDIEELRYKPFIYEGLKVNHTLLNDCSFNMVLPIFRGNDLWGLALLHRKKDDGPVLDWELRDYLSAVTAQVSSFVFHNEASQEVAENAQFAAFSRMSAFVLHDLKNVLAQIDLILCNAEHHKGNPEFIEDTFDTLQHTKARMEKMLRQLTDKNAIQDSQRGKCKASAVIADIIARKCAGNLPKPELETFAEKQLMLDEEKFANVLYHLINNAQQATDDDGQVNVVVDLTADEQALKIKIIDDGEGMSEHFIANRLFKPFDTTKGNAGMGIGAYDAKNFIEKIGGQLDVISIEGAGSTFTLTIPLG